MLRFVKTISLLVVLVVVAINTALAEAPYINPVDDSKHLGSMENIREWTPSQKVASFRNFDSITQTRTVKADGVPYPLPEAPRELDQVMVRVGDETFTVDEYFTRQNVAGLLVVKDGEIAYERYGLGNTRETKWVSYSVAKSVVSMLIGAAIKDGFIVSVDEKVTDYLPRLKGSPYDDASIRDLLQMSSGVLWSEVDYENPEEDINKVPWSALGLYQYMKALPRGSDPGTVWNYNTGETRIVGNLLRSAIGNNLSFYLTEKIWRPFGMESEANWILTGGGGESGGCCISATLRDYARLGLFALADGKLPDGSRVLPEDWMSESTTRSKAWEGYGYFWWLVSEGVYQAIGIHGQAIRIDTNENIVIGLHSARAIGYHPSDRKMQNALLDSLTKAVSD